MSINIDTKELYIANPKTGSGSVRKYLNEIDGFIPLRFFTTDKQLLKRLYEEDYELCSIKVKHDNYFTDHHPARIIKKYLEEKGYNWDDFFTFTTIRNPYEKVLSAYRYKLFQKEEIDFNEQFKLRGAENKCWHPMYKIEYMAYDLQNNCLLNKIIDLPRVKIELERMFKKPFNYHLKKTFNGESYHKRFTPEMIQYTQIFFKEDIQLFKYKYILPLTSLTYLYYTKKEGILYDPINKILVCTEKVHSVKLYTITNYDFYYFDKYDSTLLLTPPKKLYNTFTKGYLVDLENKIVISKTPQKYAVYKIDNTVYYLQSTNLDGYSYYTIDIDKHVNTLSQYCKEQKEKIITNFNISDLVIGDINLFIEYFVPNSTDVLCEYLTALYKNIQNPYVKRVYLMTVVPDLVPDCMRNCNKVVVVNLDRTLLKQSSDLTEIPERLVRKAYYGFGVDVYKLKNNLNDRVTFKYIVDYINNGQFDGEIIGIINADIILKQEDNWLELDKYLIPLKTGVVLSRYECSYLYLTTNPNIWFYPDKNLLLTDQITDHPFLKIKEVQYYLYFGNNRPEVLTDQYIQLEWMDSNAFNPSSADGWFFKAPISLKDINFTVGACPTCDNGFAYRMYNSGYRSYNLANQFTLLHYDRCREYKCIYNTSGGRMVLSNKNDYCYPAGKMQQTALFLCPSIPFNYDIFGKNKLNMELFTRSKCEESCFSGGKNILSDNHKKLHELIVPINEKGEEIVLININREMAATYKKIAQFIDDQQYKILYYVAKKDIYKCNKIKYIPYKEYLDSLERFERYNTYYLP